MFGEREPPNDPSSPFKEKEKGGEGRSKGRSKARWPMECSKLGGQWKEKEKFPLLGGQWKEKEKFYSLGGQWKEKEKFPLLGGQWNVPLLGGQWNMKEKPFSPLLIFPSTNLLKPSIFSFDLEVLFYHGLRSLFMPFLPFPRFINYKCASRRTKSFTPSLSIRFYLKI
jgi:hypothetical protein